MTSAGRPQAPATATPRVPFGPATSLVTAVAIAGVFVASDAGVEKLGFLLWFRHEGRGVGADGLALLSVFGLGLSLAFGTLADGGDDRRLAVAADVIVKLSLLAGVAFMFANPDLPQLQNKSLPLRAVFYPLLALAIPATYGVRRPGGPYPVVVDTCWSFALAIDVVGNDLHWYGNFRHWDDVVHCLNAVPLMVAISALLLGIERNGNIKLGFVGIALVALAVFTALHSLWEASEYLMDSAFGTVLQPGGMGEATRNHLWSIAGALGGIALISSWRRAGRLDGALTEPAAAFLR
jgi:hypothetical protein